MVGLRQLVGAFDGADPYTLQKWSTAERILNGALGAFSLVTTEDEKGSGLNQAI